MTEINKQHEFNNIKFFNTILFSIIKSSFAIDHEDFALNIYYKKPLQYFKFITHLKFKCFSSNQLKATWTLAWSCLECQQPNL